jgi:hypothetical protein
MTSLVNSLRHRTRRGVAAATLFTLSASGLIVGGRAEATSFTLPLGSPGLAEMRTSQILAPGVTLTRIVRGTLPTTVDQIGTTSQGPWRVNLLSIDPALARGHLQATYGPDLARAEKVTDLVRISGAVAGTNASYFTYTANLQYPGEPRGLGLYRGALLSEPAAVSTEVDLVVDAKTNKVSVGRLTWTGQMRNRSTGKTLRLKYLNHPPVVPSGCTKTADQTACTRSGDTVHFTPQFGRSTPRGYGVELVLDSRGCKVRSYNTRGVVLAANQTSIQATGRETKTLIKLTKAGCLSREVKLYDEGGKQLRLSSGLFGVAGRYKLTKAGKIVVPSGSSSFFARNPRTLAGRTADGTIVLATIDGRQTTSVGATLAETAQVAQALGMVDAVNLDGGGSTTLSVRGALANQPSGSSGERAVGDALVYIDSPLPNGS